MDLKAYFQATKPQERDALAKDCDTSADYLYLCARGDRRPGPQLAKRLAAAEPRLTLAELRPDLWSDQPA
ncbi:hypothetical protein [Ralstonia sp. Ralssp135]|uniref:hypothetical protein n=1 Tax=Ralstonia sp. Ralssp135 TaxID=3243016 RepID=UPI0039B119E6